MACQSIPVDPTQQFQTETKLGVWLSSTNYLNVKKKTFKIIADILVSILLVRNVILFWGI